MPSAHGPAAHAVAYFGPAGSYTHRAAEGVFGVRAKLVSSPGILDAFGVVRDGAAKWGVVPFENVTSGLLEETMWALLDERSRPEKERLDVCGEIAMRIDLALLARGRLDQVRVVCSHRVPLLRCRRWLAERLPRAGLREVDSTAAAARWAAKDRNVAAIAGAEVAEDLGLRVLESPVGPGGVNVTQFVVIGREPAWKARGGQTMLWLTLPHRPGALMRALAVFARAGLNLTRLASHALPENFREYAFLVTFAGRVGTPRVDRALARLGREADSVHVLGSYPVWTRL